MAIYEEYGIPGSLRAFGRCIGHGGMPVDLPPTTPRTPKQEECIVEFTDKRLYISDENITVGFNGYAQMLLQGNQVTINYVDVHGKFVFTESFVTEDGNLRRTGATNLLDLPAGAPP
jgi:hypothetical protein